MLPRARAGPITRLQGAVRDHIKSILAKTETTSRGELLSRLFHDHAYAISEFTQI